MRRLLPASYFFAATASTGKNVYEFRAHLQTAAELCIHAAWCMAHGCQACAVSHYCMCILVQPSEEVLLCQGSILHPAMPSNTLLAGKPSVVWRSASFFRRIRCENRDVSAHMTVSLGTNVMLCTSTVQAVEQHPQKTF